MRQWDMRAPTTDLLRMHAPSTRKVSNPRTWSLRGHARRLTFDAGRVGWNTADAEEESMAKPAQPGSAGDEHEKSQFQRAHTTPFLCAD